MDRAHIQPCGILSRLRSMTRRLLVPTIAVLLASGLLAQGARNGQSQQPTRDTPAQTTTPAPPAGKITGRILAADTGRPIKRARAYASAPELPEGRGTLTDDNGVFELPELPAGRYTLNASKSGFVTLSYGQRRPFLAGTPLQLAEGQQMGGIEFRLPRGSVVAGHILDESGDPMPGVNVRVMRYQYAQGERQLTPAGTAQTDDQGSYRVWGLNPGEYYVSAVTRNFNFGARGFGGPGIAGGPGGGRGARGGGRGVVNSRGILSDASGDGDETQLAYAPTYYPGVGTVGEARAVTVGVSQQLLDVNFNLLLVRTAHIAGTVTNPDGSPTTSGQLNLTPEGTTGRGQIGGNFSGRIDWDGTFELANVPPGRYLLRARGTDTEQPQYASQPLTVASGDLSDVSVILYPGATISGTVTFEGSDAPDITQVRLTAPSTEGAAPGPNPNARVDKDGKFTLAGVAAGSHWIRSAGQLRGWSLKSVLVNGRDMVDTPMDLRSDQKLNNVNVIFTNKLTQVSGTVTNEQSMPVTDFTVLAFPTDPSLWRPLARQIMTARPDQTGKYQIRGLPPGDYYLATVDPAEQGEWFEPAFLDQQRLSAARLLLSDGDVKTHDFRISTR
jgi:carboxypeptidase family protein